MTKHKRNLAVAGGVISSILLSPVLAALAVGKFIFNALLIVSVSVCNESIFCVGCFGCYDVSD